jgi:hypothetical protein
MPARDPFYNNRACEIAANIVMAELEMFRGTVFSEIDSFCNGEVIATTKAGTTLILKWDVEHQCIRTVEVQPALDQVRVVQLAA